MLLPRKLLHSALTLLQLLFHIFQGCLCDVSHLSMTHQALISDEALQASLYLPLHSGIHICQRCLSLSHRCQ